MARNNSFSKHAAPYLRQALKAAAKTYHRGKRPRTSVLSGLRKKRDDLNRKIKVEKQRGRI